ncbi:CPBP family intramembrane glutamic endopeptidase [Sphingomonas sp.]|uniref:CPBP family intramembrane glutamic endopeptidase n=1 Tax=Sphingomonas sp. TaxID=28214 RepID=UPI0038B0D03E
MNRASPAGRAWTYVGLVIAFFGIPAVNLVFKLAGYTRKDDGAIVVRELAILALVAALLWIVRSGERLPWSSIGLRRQPVGFAILWTLAAIAAFAAALFLCLGLLLPALGLTYGGQGGPAVSLGVTTLVVMRAGLAEEVFYRGYAIERLEALSGSRAVAAIVPLVLFAGFHFSQGIAGVLIAFFVGSAATAIYLWKRNLAILIAAHFTVDFVPNVLLPLIAGNS